MLLSVMLPLACCAILYVPAANGIALEVLTVKALLFRTNVPCETYRAGCVVSPGVSPDIRVSAIGRDPRLTVPPEAPVIWAAVVLAVVPVPRAL